MSRFGAYVLGLVSWLACMCFIFLAISHHARLYWLLLAGLMLVWVSGFDRRKIAEPMNAARLTAGTILVLMFMACNI